MTWSATSVPFPDVMRYPFETVRNDCLELGSTDVVRTASPFPTSLIGGAHEFTLCFLHGACPVECQRTAAVGAEHQPGEKAGRTFPVPADILHNVPQFL